MATWGGVLAFVTADSFVFKQKIYCSFLKIERIGHRTWGSQNWSFFCGCHKCMTSKWFKITNNSIVRDCSFFFNIKPQARHITLLPTSLMAKPPKLLLLLVGTYSFM